MTTKSFNLFPSISDLFNKYGISILTNSNLNWMLNGFATKIIASAIAGLPTSILSLVKTDQWKKIFSWRSGLDVSLASYLDGEHIAAMPNAFMASPAMGSKLTRQQLISLLAFKGPYWLATMDQDILKTFNVDNLASALWSCSASDINILKNSDWDIISKAQPYLKAKFSDFTKELSNEIKLLPLDFQTKFNQIFNDNGLKIYANTFLSPTELATKPYIGSTFTNGNNFITLYDSYYNQYLSKNSNDLGALKTFYAQVVSRQSIITNSVASSILPADVNILINWLNSTHNTLVPAAPPATGTDVLSYILNVRSALYNEIGKFKNISDCLSEICNQISDLSSLELDSTTHVKFDSRVIMWLLNNAPTVGNGNLSYGGKNGLTFQDAILTAERDLILEADTFVRNCNNGIKQVIENKRVADAKAKIAEILDIVGGIISLGAGLGKTFQAFKGANSLDIGVKLLSAIGKDTSAIFTLVKAESANWLKPTKSVNTGTTYYNNLASSVSNLGDVLNQYGVSSALEKEVNNFTLDLNNLIVTINDNLQQGKDLIGTCDKRWTGSFSDFLGDWTAKLFSFDAKDINGNLHGVVFSPPENSDYFNKTTIFDGPPIEGYTTTKIELKN